MTPRYTPLGRAVGVLETIRREWLLRTGETQALGDARRVFLVWHPGEDEMSDLIWFGVTEGTRPRETDEE